MPKRVESPSSINTYFQCPRKYYYHYILSLPGKESIATIAGKALHSTIESFFSINAERLNSKKIEQELKQKLLEIFLIKWQDAIPILSKLDSDKYEIQSYYQESLEMLENFIDNFFKKIEPFMNGNTFAEAFNKFKPKTEVFIQSNEMNIRGFIDAIHETDGEVYILDYKTSRKEEFSPEYRRQLAIYSCLYLKEFNKLPHKVGLLFLRSGTEMALDVENELLNEGKLACEHVQARTAGENIEEYPRNVTPLCKWRTGQCDYYEVCFNQKSLEEF